MRYIFLMLFTAIAAALPAQVVTTDPAVVTVESAPVTIIFHADEGSRGLAGVSSTSAVYAHTGVIIRGESGWQKAPQWLDNATKYRLTYVGPDTWKLTIPSIAEYYGLTPQQVEKVEKLMFVFRNADGSREGKTSTGGDIAVEVSPAGFHLSLSSTPQSRVINSGDKATVTVSTTAPAKIEISIEEPDGNSITSSSDSHVTTYSVTTTPDTPGSYTVKVKATSDNGQTASSTASLLCLAPTATAAYPGGNVRQGAVMAAADGSATFAIAAPGKSSVLLIGSWNDFALEPSQQMTRATERVELPADTSYIKNAWSLVQPFFFTTVGGLEPGERYTYYYLVDGEKAVGDPYARLILDPDNDRFIPSEVFPDMPEYPADKVPEGVILSVLDTSAPASLPKPLADRKAQDNLVIYELLIRDFTGDGTGNGTIAGVIEHLDYIKSLGVDAVELMPVMEFSGNNSWGYNPIFYFAPDKAYGSPDDYRRLVDEIHVRGMAVIFDVVMNQADGRHPWQLMYAPAENPFFNATPPHSYNVFHDWNQDNPLVFRQWADMLRYWTEEYGADGFRFDLVKGMGDQGSYGIAYNRAANSFATPSEASTNRYNPSRVERMRRLRAELAEILPDTYFICEDLATAEEDRGLASFGAMDWANINYAACQWAMGYSDGADLSRFYAPKDGDRPFGSTVSYAESHDEQRCAYKQQQWGVSAVKASAEMQMRRLGSIAAMMLMTPGSHMIWQFEELGDAQNVKQPSGDNDTSPRRTAWHLLDRKPNSDLRDTYAALLALRRAHPDLFTATTTVSSAMTPSAWNTGYTLSLASPAGKRLVVAANPLPDKTLTIAAGAHGMKVVAASPDTDPVANGNGSVTLAPGAFAVLGNEAVVSGITDIVTDFQTGSTTIYTVTGQRVESSGLAPGLYIVVGPDGRAAKQFVR